MEVGDSATENLYYIGLDSSRVTRPMGYPADTTTNPNNYVAELGGPGNGSSTTPVIGPGMLLKVMAGDQVSIRATSWYQLNGAVPGQPVTAPLVSDLLTSLISGISGLPGVEGPGLSALQSNTPTLSANVFQFLSDTGSTIVDTKPHAFLNWILLDNQFNYVAASSGFLQVGDDTLLDQMVEPNLPMTSSGYLYIYTSNETPNIAVFFDNLQVTHVRGPLLEENHYYPFGLTMAGISNEALKALYPENKYLFNKGSELQNKEFSDGSGLEMYTTKLRELDPQLGRWWEIDSKPTQAESPYSAMGNNPILHNDFLGDTTGGGFFQGVAQGFTGYFTSAYNAVTHPGQTLKSAFSLQSIGQNALNAVTLGGYGLLKDANNNITTITNNGLYGVGEIVGNKAAEVATFVATDAAGKALSAVTSSAVDAALNVGVTHTAETLKSLEIYPSTIVGGRLPNNEISIKVSGPPPVSVTGSMQESADNLGGVGAKSAGNTVGCCAEFHVANELLKTNPQYSPTDIKWTPAIRPRTSEVVPMCSNCGTMFTP